MSKLYFIGSLKKSLFYSFDKKKCMMMSIICRFMAKRSIAQELEIAKSRTVKLIYYVNF